MNESNESIKFKINLAYILEFIVFETRWLLLPMYIGLSIGLIAYTCKFLIQVYQMIIGFNTIGENLMPIVLGLVDIVMVGNLLVMIIIGSYAIFIKKICIVSKDKPQWLDHINAGTLKVKMGTSLIGVSSIHLLQDFINANEQDWNIIWKRISIHTMFILSTIALAISDRIIHPPENNNNTNKEIIHH